MLRENGIIKRVILEGITYKNWFDKIDNRNLEEPLAQLFGSFKLKIKSKIYGSVKLRITIEEIREL